MVCIWPYPVIANPLLFRFRSLLYDGWTLWPGALRPPQSSSQHTVSPLRLWDRPGQGHGTICGEKTDHSHESVNTLTVYIMSWVCMCIPPQYVPDIKAFLNWVAIAISLVWDTKYLRQFLLWPQLASVFIQNVLYWWLDVDSNSFCNLVWLYIDHFRG